MNSFMMSPGYKAMMNNQNIKKDVILSLSEIAVFFEGRGGFSFVGGPVMLGFDEVSFTVEEEKTMFRYSKTIASPLKLEDFVADFYEAKFKFFMRKREIEV